MKRSTGGILIVGGLFLLLLLFNLLFFVDVQGQDENEQNGSRSSYRSTLFGTLAFYTLLQESGYKVTRFERPFTKLNEHPELSALVVISIPDSRPPSQEEFNSLAEWIESGGLLVVIDRVVELSFEGIDIKTSGDAPLDNIRPLQPTYVTRGVESVALSEFASHVDVTSTSVTYHIGNGRAAIVADSMVGDGRVVLVSDPFLVANNGISQADNAVLAVNLFANLPSGTIAFDEFHHGFGSTQNSGVLAYFRGTPVPWMLAQASLIAVLMVYSFGRRFGRPLPLRKERRTSNLEFVSSMANITRLARANDVAMQNIYFEFRKRLCRYGGLPSKSEIPRIASAVSKRSSLDERQLNDLLTRCDQIAGGEHSGESELLRLVDRIRQIESELRLS
jgi:hypothetical protein